MKMEILIRSISYCSQFVLSSCADVFVNYQSNFRGRNALNNKNNNSINNKYQNISILFTLKPVFSLLVSAARTQYKSIDVLNNGN